MEVNRFRYLFFKALRRQDLQNKETLHAEIFRQEFLAIETAGDHLPDTAFPEALADLAQGGKGRFSVTQPVDRIEAAVEN